MAKKHTPSPKPSPKAEASNAGQPLGRSFSFDSWYPWLAIAATIVVYLPALGADFTNWDDQHYVYENIVLQTPGKLSELLTKPFAGNWHPLTMLSLWLNFQVSGLEPWSYHLLNVLLHLTNVFLVWKLAHRLSNGHTLVAFGTALFFGVHPLHVESVAWIAERKDVLYGVFFLLGLLQWLRYTEKNNWAAYALAMVFFVLSALAKPAAVVFPLAVAAIDWYQKRPFDQRFWLDKMPLLAVSGVFAYITLSTQSEVGATDLVEKLGWGTRIIYACYGLMMYLVKTVVPYPLVTFYPLPGMNTPLPWPYWLAPFFVAALAFAGFYWGRERRELSFGLLFYLVNLLLVIQLIPVGSAIISDRYSYMPHVGIFFAVTALLARSSVGGRALGPLVWVFGLLFALLAFFQVSTWTNGETLWDHAIRHLPSPTAYKNRALLYLEAAQKDPKTTEAMRDKALECYDRCLQLDPKQHEAYTQRGLIYYNRKQYPKAVEEASRAIELKPTFVIALNNRGIAYMGMGENAKAVEDFDRAIASDPTYERAWKNRGMAYFDLRQFDRCIADMQQYLTFAPKDKGDIFNTIGVAQQQQGDFEGSLKSFEQALPLTEKKGSVYVNRAYSYLMLKRQEEAVRDGKAALEAGANLPADMRRVLGL
jgi:tetratricopeptide (TPR) repeat protein